MQQRAQMPSARADPQSRPRSLATLAVGFGLLQGLGACVLNDRLDPALEVPKNYRAAHLASEAALPPLEWWRGFRSAELADLMDQALAANFDIAAAVARIVQADAQARIAGAALLPSINATASAQRSKSSRAAFGGTSGASGGGSGGSSAGGAVGGGGARTLYTVALNASYQLDFWGRVRALIRAADYSALASRFDREVVALSTLVSVADTYFLVLEGQDRLRVARENLASSERILKLIQDRFNNGTASALEVAQQGSLTAIVRASIPPLVEQIQQNTATLALLVGRAPENLVVRGGSMYRLNIPRVSPGLPSELLTQRPDIREAELKLASADANVYAARAAFLPSIQLTGQGGFESAALRTLFGPSAVFYTIAATLTQPIFQGGLLLGQLDLQKGAREELLQDYRKTVISAFTDVERALVAVQQTTRQEALQRQAVAESRKAFELSEERLRAGTIDLTTVLQAEQTFFQQEDTLALVRFARLQAIVSLFQALGGGWFLDREPIARPLDVGPNSKS
jgi:NodT family efflux transporter outer membrane factor (OMF) lipoprotein